jgi:hypothetical protein
MPLWPSLRNALPHRKPSRKTQPTLWRYGDVRPQLMRAGELTPIEKAERRVLVLCNPGLGIDELKATPTIYIGLQPILPGETAPAHKHSPLGGPLRRRRQRRLHGRAGRKVAAAAQAGHLRSLRLTRLAAECVADARLIRGV